MKKKLLILLSIVVLLLCSCDIMGPQPPKSKMYLIACGLGYQNSPWNSLDNPLTDSEAIVGQFEELCKAGGNEYEIVWYSDNQNITDADRNSPRRFSFRHIKNGVTSVPAIPLLQTDTMAYMNPDKFISLFFKQVNELFTEKPTENDLLIFYFSGHGDISLGRADEGGPYLYYGTVETTSCNDSKVNASFALPICYDRIFKNLDKYDGRQLCIFDCCYSGASIENPGHFHTMNSNELGTTDRFKESYEYDSRTNTLSRFDTRMKFSLSAFMASSMDATLDDHFPGMPKRMCLNASSYGQTAMDSDTSNAPNIRNYGGMTYRILEYMGYDLVNMRPAPPTHIKNKVITVSNLYEHVYDNISKTLMETSTPNVTKSSYDMLLWDFR